MSTEDYCYYKSWLGAWKEKQTLFAFVGFWTGQRKYQLLNHTYNELFIFAYMIYLVWCIWKTADGVIA